MNITLTDEQAAEVAGILRALHADNTTRLAALFDPPEAPERRPVVLVDPETFRNVYDEHGTEPDELAVVEAATDDEIEAALRIGFSGDFWWNTYDNCMSEALALLIRVKAEV